MNAVEWERVYDGISSHGEVSIGSWWKRGAQFELQLYIHQAMNRYPVQSRTISVRVVVNGKHVVEHRQRDILLTGEEDLVWEINGTLGKPMHSVQRETPSREHREARRNPESHCGEAKVRMKIDDSLPRGIVPNPNLNPYHTQSYQNRMGCWRKTSE